MVNITQKLYVPSHPALFIVDHSSTSHACLRAQNVCPFDVGLATKSHSLSFQHFEEGETIDFLDGHSKGFDAYITLQCGPNDRIELRSDLAHSESLHTNFAFACY
jgi:hypothetical protein